MEIQPRSAKLNLVLTQDAQVSNKDTGEVYDVAAAAARLPWVDFHWGGGRGMPRHQFVALGKAHDRAWDALDDRAWDVLDFVIRKHPDSYRAYFRGYQYQMRYWELGNWRYWRMSWRAFGCSIDLRSTRSSPRAAWMTALSRFAGKSGVRLSSTNRAAGGRRKRRRATPQGLRANRFRLADMVRLRRAIESVTWRPGERVSYTRFTLTRTPRNGHAPSTSAGTTGSGRWLESQG